MGVRTEEDNLILGYKQPVGGQEPYHYGKIPNEEGKPIDRKFIRVVAGACLPIFDRMLGAVVIIAEIYRASGPASWVVLDAKTGEWSIVENAMAQFRMDLKFTYVIVEHEEDRKVIWEMKGLRWGLNEIPCISYAAPFYAPSEIGRSHVTQIWRKEERLTIPEHVQAEMESEPQTATVALQCAMCWIKDHPAYYAPLRQSRPNMQHVIGVDGL